MWERRTAASGRDEGGRAERRGLSSMEGSGAGAARGAGALREGWCLRDGACVAPQEGSPTTDTGRRALRAHTLPLSLPPPLGERPRLEASSPLSKVPPAARILGLRGLQVLQNGVTGSQAALPVHTTTADPQTSLVGPQDTGVPTRQGASPNQAPPLLPVTAAAAAAATISWRGRTPSPYAPPTPPIHTCSPGQAPRAVFLPHRLHQKGPGVKAPSGQSPPCAHPQVPETSKPRTSRTRHLK